MNTVMDFYCLKLLSLANVFNTVKVAKCLTQLWPCFALGAKQWDIIHPLERGY